MRICLIHFPWPPFGHLFEGSFSFIVQFWNVKNDNDYNYKQLLINRVICGVPVPGTKEKTRRSSFFIHATSPFILSSLICTSFHNFIVCSTLPKPHFRPFSTILQYKNPNIQRGSFAPSGISQSSANTKESSTPAICEKSLLRPPTSKVYFASTLKSP